MDWWAWGWIGWGLWFAVEETLAFVKVGTPGTLSYLVWTLGGTRSGATASPSGWTRLRRFGLAAAMAWLSLHFLTGGAF